MKLFMVYIGGSFRNTNTELHDVRFSIGDIADLRGGPYRRPSDRLRSATRGPVLATCRRVAVGINADGSAAGA